MIKECQKRANRKYAEKLHTTILRFNMEKDADIVAMLSEQPNKTEYIRGLIRKDIKCRS